MIEPMLSVVMPVYNGEKYLREAIESILNQSLRDFEFLIINDGSTDRSRHIVESFADSRIRLLDNEQNIGLVASLNKGIDVARGRYIARMDADDVSHLDRLEKQVSLLETGKADICGCHWLVINEAGKLVDAKIMPLCANAFTVFLAYTVPFAHGSVMIRSSFIREHSIRYGEAKYAEDYRFWIDMFEKGAKFANVDEFLFRYREASGTLSQRLRKQNIADSKALRRRFVRANADSCIHAIQDLAAAYSNLSQSERVYLLLASYLVSIAMRRFIVFDIIRQSNRKSIGIAILYFFRGI